MGKDKYLKDYNETIGKKVNDLMLKNPSKVTEDESYYLETIKGIIGEDQYTKLRESIGNPLSPSMRPTEYNKSPYSITINITEDDMNAFILATETNTYTAPVGIGLEEVPVGAKYLTSVLSKVAAIGKEEEIVADVSKTISEGNSSIIVNTAGNVLEFGELLPESALNKRQREILDLLSNSGDTTIIRKKSVSMNDLGQLTNVTGDEFNLFTKGSERLIIRGQGNVIRVSEEMYDDILSGQYGKFSGHTHPGLSLNPGPADEPFLKLLGQKRSSIWGNGGQGWESFGQEPWLTQEIRAEIRHENMVKLYGGQ